MGCTINVIKIYAKTINYNINTGMISNGPIKNVVFDIVIVTSIMYKRNILKTYDVIY